LNTRAINVEVFYSVKGKKDLTTDTVRARLGDIAWYKDVGQTVGTQLEQRGVGRLLYDFENERLDWKISSYRTQTDTIKLSLEQAHRGNVSLKLDTQLISGSNKSYIYVEWSKFVPQGGWIANIYLPDNVPADTRIWANFYTYSQSDWQGSPTLSLTKGAWNTIIWDTYAVDWGEKEKVTLGIQIGAEGGPYQGPIYIDDVQAFER
jgi:hypothetical protein